MAGNFSNPRDPEGKIIREKIAEWLLLFEPAYADARIDIEDVPCQDPGCPDRETLISINNTERKEIRIRKPLVYVRKWDIEFALSQEKNQSRA